MKNIVFPFSADQIAAFKSRAEFYTIFLQHEAATNGILKIINNAMSQQAIWFVRQNLGNRYMVPLDYPPAQQLPPDFPSYLPPSLASVVQEKSQETSLDYLTTTMALLGAISTALCGRYFVDCRNINGWRGEPVCLYIMLIAPPGSKKSALIASAKNVLSDVMAELQQEYDRTAPERRYAAELKQKILDKMANEYVKEELKKNGHQYKPAEFRQLMTEAEAYARDTGKFREEITSEISRARLSLFIGEFSLPGLIEALVVQGEHQAFIDDEGGIFEKINDKGLWRERDLMRKAYDQAEYSQERHKKRTYLKNPCMNYVLATQLSVAIKFFINAMHKERGLAFRFIPILSVSGQINNPFISFGEQVGFDEKLQRLLKANFTQESRRESIYMERAGVERVLGLQAENSAIAASHPYMDGFLRKLHGMACRIAGVLHLWDFLPEIPIRPETVERAIMIAKAVIPHAEEVFSPSGFSVIDAALRIEAWFKDTGNIDGQIRDINIGIGSDLDKRDIELGFERLIKFSRAAQIFDADNRPIYVINPQIMPDHLSRCRTVNVLPPPDFSSFSKGWKE